MARNLTAREIFDLGYAIPMYDISKEVRHWRFKEREVTLPWDAVDLVEVPGIRFYVARIEDVDRAVLRD